MIKNSNFNFLIVFHFFAFFLFILLTIEKDLPESISTSRAPWIDESLKITLQKILLNMEQHSLMKKMNSGTLGRKFLFTLSGLYHF